MDKDRFDDLARMMAGDASRRQVLRRLAGGALGGVFALGGLTHAGAGGKTGHPPCREAGHPCKGHQACCKDLYCRVTGPDNAKRCARCPRGLAGHPCNDRCKCAGDNRICQKGRCCETIGDGSHHCKRDSDCCSGKCDYRINGRGEPYGHKVCLP